MNNTANFSLKIGFDGNNITPVALGNHLILQNVPNLRLAKELLQLTADLLPGRLHLLTQPPQLLAGLIQDQPMRADRLLNGLPDFCQITQLLTISG